MKKSLKNIDPGELELLVSRESKVRHGAGLSKRAIFYLLLLLFALIGFLSCLWAMLNTSKSEDMAQRMGMETVARVLDNALSLLAYPFLMFTGILAAYAVQQLYREYRAANYMDVGRRS